MLEATYAFTHSALPPLPLPVRVQFTVGVHGLGDSLVHTHIAAVGIRTRLLVLCTPTEGASVDLRIACSVTHSPVAMGGARAWPGPP